MKKEIPVKWYEPVLLVSALGMFFSSIGYGSAVIFNTPIDEGFILHRDDYSESCSIVGEKEFYCVELGRVNIITKYDYDHDL